MPMMALTTPSPSIAAATPEHSSSSSQQTNSSTSFNRSTLSSSPRHIPTDLSFPIPEEHDETESERNEPLTPVSLTHSTEFTLHDRTSPLSTSITSDHLASSAPESTLTAKPSVGPIAIQHSTSDPFTTSTKPSRDNSRRTSTVLADAEPVTPNLTRRPTRGSTSSFKLGRAMSSFFRRGASFTSDNNNVFAEAGTPTTENARSFSINKTTTNTPRSVSPHSPGSPTLEMKGSNTAKSKPSVPSNDDFVQKTKRTSTGFSFRPKAINFANGNNNNNNNNNNRQAETSTARSHMRRASSFDHGKGQAAQQQKLPHIVLPPETANVGRQIIYMAADSGVGVKSRRLSLSLPDDYLIDIVDLATEYEYQHKFLSRHRDNLGKGATAKVRVMTKKGCPTELYAVKEFRGKASSETKEEYDNKVKSEFSISKSLHHPNIVETVRLCTDHGRWDHVMEYCSEGDLFGLIQKGYLKKEDRANDRLCLFKQLIQGLAYLHHNGIAHRDIKCENLLITKDSKLKITDFGVSEVFTGIHPGLREAGGQCGKNMGEIRLCAPGICGSEPYVSPEIMAKKQHYDPRGADVWGAAIVMITLIAGAPLWEKAVPGAHNSQFYDLLVKGWDKWNAKHADATPQQCIITETDYPVFMPFDTFVNPPALRRVLLQMLNPDPARRATIDEVAKNRWVKNIECCQAESYDDPSRIIDATKKSGFSSAKKIFCHTHIPPKSHGAHSIGKMPGQPGY